MRAILLSAGLGTRLRPMTDNIPKCLVPINGKPLLQIWLERLSAAGIGPFLVNTHYLSKQVEKFIEGSEFKDQVELVYEPELLGTAGTLIKNIDFFQGKDGLLIHADNYCLADFNAFIRAHENRPNICTMTMMTFRTDDPSSCGIVEIDDQGIVIGFHEKVELPPTNFANGAIYILSHDLIELAASKFSKILDISLELLPNLVHEIYTYETKNIFMDIGTIRNYDKANFK
jgi:mannose-1-phosphate guanylyltransferase